MAVWDELKVVLARLRDEQPGAMTHFPMPEVDHGRQPPFVIGLAPSAARVAEQLHERFGDDVQLTVGALPYPASGHRRQPPPGPPSEPLDPQRVTAELAGPATVKSGQTLRHGLVIANHSGPELQISTNGGLTADIVDPVTGEVVGGYAGFQTTALVRFGVAPGTRQRIPLLIGTASFVPRLGYAVPPGDWGVRVTLTLGDFSAPPSRRLTPVLPLTVIA